MALLEWKDEYKTGIPSIDYEHEHLIGSINGMFDKVTDDRSSLLDTLGEIHALVEAHFALEEKIMRDSRYLQYNAHKTDHDQLLDDIRDIMDDVDTGQQTDIGADLQNRMSSWFGTHFANLDKDLHTTMGH